MLKHSLFYSAANLIIFHVGSFVIHLFNHAKHAQTFALQHDRPTPTASPTKPDGATVTLPLRYQRNGTDMAKRKKKFGFSQKFHYLCNR